MRPSPPHDSSGLQALRDLGERPDRGRQQGADAELPDSGEGVEVGPGRVDVRSRCRANHRDAATISDMTAPAMAMRRECGQLLRTMSTPMTKISAGQTK